MKNTVLGIILCLGIWSCQKTHYVILMGGQSNMVGSGNIDDLDQYIMPDNFKYYNYGMSPGFKASPQDRFGPEIGICQILSAKYPDKSFILIKYAIGGASMLNWSPDYDPNKARVTGNPELFGNMYKDFHHKIDSILGQVKHEKIALLWMQGERDARIPEAGIDYSINFKQFIESFRSDIKVNDLPILFGKINPPVERYPALENVRMAQEMILKEIDNTYLINTDDLEKWDDMVHYSSKGQLELGMRFGEQLILIMKNSFQDD